MNDAEAHEFYADPANLAITGPPVKRRGQRLTTMSSVRFAPEAIEAVKGLASEEGVTVGSWIRRLVQREIGRREPDVVEVPGGGLPEPLRIPGDALRAVFAAMMPALAALGTVDLRIGPLGAERPAGLIEGSGRRGEPKSLPSSPRRRSFACPHLSVGNVASVTCEQCGPLAAAA